MKPKLTTSARATLPEIFREVRESISVYLTQEGLEILADTQYIREGGYIACRKIAEISNSPFLHMEVRHYHLESKTPKYTYVSIPHEYVRYMSSEKQYASFVKKRNVFPVSDN